MDSKTGGQIGRPFSSSEGWQGALRDTPCRVVWRNFSSTTGGNRVEHAAEASGFIV